MSLNLQQIRDLTREHMCLDEDDLTDALIDQFARDASKRIERAEVRWPFFEVRHDVTITASSMVKSTISDLLDQIHSITIDSYGPLTWVGPDVMSDMQRRTTTGRPRFWSEWSGSIYFYPTPDTAYTGVLQGYRRGDDWVAAGAGGEPDMDEDLHNAVLTWCLARAYTQQEDPEMGAVYERQFSDELNEMRRRLVVAPLAQPFIGGGGFKTNDGVFGRLRYSWE